jgi:hypothetical protein
MSKVATARAKAARKALQDATVRQEIALSARLQAAALRVSTPSGAALREGTPTAPPPALSGLDAMRYAAVLDKTRSSSRKEEMRSPEVEMRSPEVEMRPPEVEMRSPEVEMRPPEVEMRSPCACVSEAAATSADISADSPTHTPTICAPAHVPSPPSSPPPLPAAASRDVRSLGTRLWRHPVSPPPSAEAAQQLSRPAPSQLPSTLQHCPWGERHVGQGCLQTRISRASPPAAPPVSPQTKVSPQTGGAGVWHSPLSPLPSPPSAEGWLQSRMSSRWNHPASPPPSPPSAQLSAAANGRRPPTNHHAQARERALARKRKSAAPGKPEMCMQE